MRFLTSSQIRDFEGRVIASPEDSLRLIDNAAHACVRELSLFGAVCVFCGKGNNGADGYRTALLLAEAGKKVQAVSVYEPSTPECAALAADCRRAGIEIVPLEKLEKAPECEAALDAVLGIGARGEVTGAARKAVELINSMDAFVVSADIPSGLDADRGRPLGACVRADKTVTFTAPKTGMIANDSVEWCGEIVVRDAGVPVDWERVPPSQPMPITPALAADILPRRPRLSHKGTFGRLLLMAGSPGMMGAASMAARAALRGGCGLVTVACPRGTESFMNLMAPQAVALPTESFDAGDMRLARAVGSASAIVMGPGSGSSLGPEFIGETVRAARGPVILDADALNALSGKAEQLSGGNVVITPHPMEFSRLTGKSVEDIEADRLGAARDFAARCGVTVLLKGARTVIAEPGGETWVSLISTSALARGGSGDILSGLLGSLCAQGLSAPEAAALAVYLHGRSGVISGEKCGEYAVTADDIIYNLKYAFMEVEGYERTRKNMGRG